MIRQLFRVIWKAPTFVGSVVVFVLVSLFQRVRAKELKTRRHYYVKTVSWICRWGVRFMNFKVTYKNAPPADQHYLQVGNHISFMDILFLAQERPSLFITSQEMREAPGIGTVVEVAGCLFVERRDRSKINEEMMQIREALQSGFNVTLYPEATSTDGQGVFPVKKTLMTSAAGTGVPILPFVLNWKSINGEIPSHKWRETICWYGDAGFFSYIVKVFSIRNAEIEITFGEPIHIHSEEERQDLAAKIQQFFIDHYIGIPYPQNVKPHFPAEKVIKTKTSWPLA